MRSKLYHPAVLLLPALLTAAPGLAQPAAAGSDRQAELERIRGQIALLESRLAELSERRDGLSGELDRTLLELDLQGRRVAESRAERAIGEAGLLESERRVAALSAALAGSREGLRRSLVALHRIGGHGALRMLLSIRSEGQLLHGVRILRFFARRAARAIDGHRARGIELDRERAELRRRQARVAELLAREAARQDELRAAERRQRRRLDELESARSRLGEETASLLDKERRLANLLDFLYGRAPGELAGTPLQEFRGVLDWPLDGRVVTRFGPRLDPRYRTRVPHNGLRIEPATGAQARVVYPGRVVFAGPLEGYGPTVVVEHPRRAFTIYAGLRGVRVGVDDVVSLGEVLGTAPEVLYFEIRVENQPQDPLDWLR